MYVLPIILIVYDDRKLLKMISPLIKFMTIGYVGTIVQL